MLKMGSRDYWVFIILLLFCYQRSHGLNSDEKSCNSSDFLALTGFANGLDSVIDGWINNSYCCNWFGVNCKDFGISGKRVVDLSLGNMKLKGSVSKSLMDLEYLRLLNLSRNSLNGTIPSGLFNFRHLEVLDLSYNEFKGEIPSKTDLPSIRVFNVSNNKFTGTHPVLVGSSNLTDFVIGYNYFNGYVNTSVCNTWSQIRVLRLSVNSFSGEFPVGLGNCSSLIELWIDSNNLRGRLPNDLFKLSQLKSLFLQGNRLRGPLGDGIGNLSNLAVLDLCSNEFSGNIPNVFGNLGKLQHFAAQSNKFTGTLPSSISNSSMLELLNLNNNSLNGRIDLNCSTMVHISSLNLGSNQFEGNIPDTLSYCSKLKTVNLAGNKLKGEIPRNFKLLQSLAYLSLTKNRLSNILSALEILQQCGSLTTIVLTRNFCDEEMPVKGIGGFENLKVLIIPNCGLSGPIPIWLRNCSKLQLLDLSWNHLNGRIPSWFGNLESLFYLDLSNNSLAGEIPKSLTKLKSLISGIITWEDSCSAVFPFFVKRNQSARGLQYNQATSFPPSLDLSNNRLTGPIWPAFGDLKKLHVLDLSSNKLSGTIPTHLSGMTSLEALDLSNNNLTGNIPRSLVQLNFLSKFNVAHNRLYGKIPSGGQFDTFPNSSFKWNEELCGEHFSPCPPKNPSTSNHKVERKKGIITAMAVGIGLGTILLLAFVSCVISRACIMRRDATEIEVIEAGKDSDFAGSNMVLLFQSKENRELTIDDMLNSTNNFDQANIVGCGGFGLVYKAIFPDLTKVAIKRLTGDCCQMEREFQAEVETLSRAQHRNLVALQGYCKYNNDRLLIYSYMENGSLDYWLHEKPDGGTELDWNTRLRIAQGAARGLAYLHQSCDPHILHRDIKSSNILLDENFEAHLADFGLARLILPCDTHVSTDLVGTLGYIPPEYGLASVATFKGDVYSFGVVLLELLTGKRPMDVCKREGCRDLISWVLQMIGEKREDEVFDPFVFDKIHEKEMLRVLEIACLCLREFPKERPCTQQIVFWLDNIGVYDQKIE